MGPSALEIVKRPIQVAFKMESQPAASISAPVVKGSEVAGISSARSAQVRPSWIPIVCQEPARNRLSTRHFRVAQFDRPFERAAEICMLLLQEKGPGGLPGTERFGVGQSDGAPNPIVMAAWAASDSFWMLS